MNYDVILSLSKDELETEVRLSICLLLRRTRVPSVILFSIVRSVSQISNLTY